MFTVIAVLFGVGGIFFASDLIQRDRERLQSETVRRSITSNLEKINANREELTRLEKLRDLLRDLWFQYVDVTPDHRRGVVVGEDGTILTTQDGGKTWNKQESGTMASLYATALSADGQKAFAVGGYGTILITRGWVVPY
jgi:hypothetical protein